MSTIQSSAEHLTLNADGSSKDIKFQANGVEKASISSAGAFTSTTIDATKLTGNLPAINASSLTSLTAANLTGALPAISGAALTNLPASGISDLTPYFMAYTGGNQVPSSGVTTKITFSEIEDSDNAYDDANNKFTVPSGEGGRYFISTGGAFYSNSSNRVTDAVFKIYKNGSQVSSGEMPLGSQYASNPGPNAVASSFHRILTLAAGDYVEIYGYVTTNSGAVSFGARTFSGFKIGT